MNRAQILDQERWDVEPEFFKVNELPSTVIELLELITSIYGPELLATAGAFHEWLNTEPDRPSGSIVSLTGEKTNHPPLGEIEYDQWGKPFKRIALIDPLIRHQDLEDKIAEMSDSELATYKDIMRKVGGQAMLDLKLEREIVRDDCCYKLG